MFLRNDAATFQRMQNEADRQNRYVIFGTLDWEGSPPNLKLFNAVTGFGPAGETLGYDYKRHLVPFGEYVPGEHTAAELMQAFGLMNILGNDYAPGLDPHLFELPFARIGAGVCYDGIFPDAVRPSVLKGAEVLALITNDAWYKDTTAPRVLLAHAVLRAVENKRYILRAANTGIASVISPVGNTLGRTPVYQDATLVGRAAPIRELTRYTRFGDWAAVLATLGFLGFWTDGRTAAGPGHAAPQPQTKTRRPADPSALARLPDHDRGGGRHVLHGRTRTAGTAQADRPAGVGPARAEHRDPVPGRDHAGAPEGRPAVGDHGAEGQLEPDSRYTYFEPNPKGKFYNLKDWNQAEGKPSDKVRSMDWEAKKAEYDSFTEDLEIGAAP